MLVKFRSSTSGEVIMFAEHAARLFAIVGKEGTARGVFTREQLPDAMARLHAAVDAEKMAARRELEPPIDKNLDEDAEDDNDDDDDDENAEKKAAATIGLAQRAHPLQLLIERTDKEEGFILWEAARDF